MKQLKTVEELTELNKRQLGKISDLAWRRELNLLTHSYNTIKFALAQDGDPEEWIRKQFDKLEKTKATINDNYRIWVECNPDIVSGLSEQKRRAKWNTMNGADKINWQLEVLRFCLED